MQLHDARTPVCLTFASLLAAVASCAFADVPAVRMTIEPSAAGLDVTYRLDKSANALFISAPADTLTVLDSSKSGRKVTFAEGALRAPGQEKRTRFSVQIAPDQAARDRIYPVLTRFAAGSLVVHLPSIIADPARYETSIEVSIPANSAVLGGTTLGRSGRVPKTVRINRDTKYLFVGPGDDVADLGFAIFAGGHVAPWLARSIQAALQSSLDDYAVGLATPLSAKPIVVVAQDADAPGSGYRWRGDTTDNFMFLRFDGVEWNSEDSRRLKTVGIFVRHETFHFWNSWMFQQDARKRYPWLVEGSAEFAGLNSALKHGAIGADEFDATMGGHLNECREVLGGEPLHGPAGAWGRAPYACGTAVQWIASFTQGGGEPTFGRFFAQWRAVFAEAALAGHAYSADGFLREAGQERAEALGLVAKAGADRWAALPGSLMKLGIPIGTRVPDMPVLRSRMIMHLLGQVCAGSFGFYERETFFTLDTGKRCPPVPEDPEVDTVEGQNIFAHAQAAYELVYQRCARNEEVAVSRGNDTAPWRVPCKKPLLGPFEYRLTSR